LSSEDAKFKTYKTIILPVVSHVPLTFMEQQRLKTFTNKMLRKEFEPV
jgi:hypothetical protein